MTSNANQWTGIELSIPADFMAVSFITLGHLHRVLIHIVFLSVTYGLTVLLSSYA